MASPSPASSATNGVDPGPSNKHALTPLERQRAQLSRLLKDPAKPVHIPAPPKEKTIRPPREMMKNVQGSSAGAGSGEFHVYKANRRREYERLKMMEEASLKESDEAEFERKRKEREEQAEAKTSKNRAKRVKKKERAKGKGREAETSKNRSECAGGAAEEGPIKKRRLVNGSQLVFRKPGEESDEEGDVDETVSKEATVAEADVAQDEAFTAPAAVVPSKVTIHDTDS